MLKEEYLSEDLCINRTPKGEDLLEDLWINRTILKWILNKRCGKVWNRFLCCPG
jgi:hypothetical protein